MSPIALQPRNKPLAAAWVMLAVAALVGAGVFAILLVLARMPWVNDFIPWQDFFRTALVIHVDLSVLVWFVACAGALWTMAGGSRWAAAGWIAVGLASVGSVLMIASPFVADGHPYLNNYVPVLHQSTFLYGLVMIGAGFAVLVMRTITTIWRGAFDDCHGAALQVGMGASAIVAAIALGVLAWTWVDVAAQSEVQAYFETLMWGSGHVLQFSHALLLIVVWFWLGAAVGSPARLANRPTAGLFVVAALPVLAAPFISLSAMAGSGKYVLMFTRLMEYGHLAMLPLGLVALHAVWVGRGAGTPDQRALRVALYSSIVLFAAGGVLGFMIRGVNVVVPAHYHGSIVGVTLGFMGLTYYLLPRLGLGTPNRALVRWQPICYGGGQLMHILGLAWSGGYGVQRKVAGSAQALHGLGDTLGMFVMGVGGLIAVVGGVLFLVACVGAILARRARHHVSHAPGVVSGGCQSPWCPLGTDGTGLCKWQRPA